WRARGRSSGRAPRLSPTSTRASRPLAPRRPATRTWTCSRCSRSRASSDWLRSQPSSSRSPSPRATRSRRPTSASARRRLRPSRPATGGALLVAFLAVFAALAPRTLGRDLAVERAHEHYLVGLQAWKAAEKGDAPARVKATAACAAAVEELAPLLEQGNLTT